MRKILGVDLGTNSIGLTLREDNLFTWYGVYTFNKGVGSGKSGEFSYAAERTKHRASRRLYNARRYRNWATLKILIENKFCPLSMEELNKWRYYKKGVGRIYPVDNISFQQWISLDFDKDGISDYTSPYQLRRELITQKFDLNNLTDRYKIGRALYHISQRRGFKSSRKVGTNEEAAIYKGSSETKTIGRNEYESLIIEHRTLGAALAHLENKGERIRNRYTLRSDYEKEVDTILDFQNIDHKFKDEIKKGIFYQRPLRSQKGLIGRCTLEPSKHRCPISHPKFEEYRAWSFLNNIKYKNNHTNQFESIPLKLKEKIYHSKFFMKSKREFEFKEIRKLIHQYGNPSWELNYTHKMDKISIPSCIVSARFKSVFGDKWKEYSKTIERTHKKEIRSITYDIDDIWHVLFSYEDREVFEEFLTINLKLTEGQIRELMTLFNSFPVGYANLSLKAIRNILPFLRQGYIYSDAVILAKIPEIIGKDIYNDNDVEIIEAIQQQTNKINKEKRAISIVNNLISKYYSLNWEDRFAVKDYSYQLTKEDNKDIHKGIVEHYGSLTWQKLDDSYKESIIKKVTQYYQDFFTSDERKHQRQPLLVDTIKNYLINNFDINEKYANNIYHPSQVEIYPKKEGRKYLGSPKTAAFKNPMAYKTLHKLRSIINHLIDTDKIDENTRIVVEVARDLNDSNKRWAIERYQRERELENIEIAKAITELIKDPDFKGHANPNSITDKRKLRLWLEQSDSFEELHQSIQKIEENTKLSVSERDIQKYRVWKEQNCVCMYTGKIIKITDLFDENIIDFEHTIPRSKSFDNSLANLTVCYADYNRNIKQNKLPTELPNYDEEALGYDPISSRLDKWKEKVDNLYQQIDFWRARTRVAADKTAKDYAIRQRHIRQMKYDYWRNKIDRFTRKEVPQGFVNSQLIDTQIITKYAYHYLKTVFSKVDIVKGSNTAEFRKIYGIHAKDESKDRSKHSHHAVDAAVLTLLPSHKKREETLKKAYVYSETNYGKQFLVKPFPGFKYSMIQEIENKILVNNIAEQDQTLTPGIKKVRKRGKTVWLDRENRKAKIARGDSIRGELHKQTYYGKIKIAATDDKGSLVRDKKGQVVYNQIDGKDEIWTVLRTPIEKVNFESNDIIDKVLAEHLKSQIKQGKKPHELKDFQGNRIRHIRCRVRSGRGYMNPKNLTKVKKQTYISDKDYKNYIWADSGDNYLFGLYENNSGRQIVSINKFEAALYIKHNKSINEKRELFYQKEPIEIRKKEAKLIHIFEVGQKVLFVDNTELVDDILNDPIEISKRLYYIRRLHQASVGNIQFQHHLESRTDEELKSDFPTNIFKSAGVNGFSKYQTDFIAPRLLFKPTRPSFLIENLDFIMTLDGEITPIER